jgi:dephospho-CoA kinase
MKIIGLTGSIAMGKSTTAQLFRESGVPVHDADAAVHELYEGAAVAPLYALVPEAIEAGKVNRERLAALIKLNPALLPQIEAIIHPLAGQHRRQFLTKVNSRLVVFDVPLLFETGGAKNVDCIVTVSCSAATQSARALARPHMSEEKLAFILSKQWPDAKKRQASHSVINTEQGLAAAKTQVQDFIKAYG